MNSTYRRYSDETILTLIAESDDEVAFTELYRRYFRVLFNYAFSKVDDRFAAQEIVQELFVSLWQQRHKHAIQACRTYLFSCIKNLIISHYRKEFTRTHHYNQWEIQHNPYMELADQLILTADLQDRYEKGLHLLSPKCKEVFLLSRRGLSNREIADQLVISEKTVEQHITKALRILKDYLKEHFVYIFLLVPLF
ncbi:RNA polymerase sigma-70 factor [Nibrella saemangeumensis]|uniref:RNA polymerase sigma factor SigS n=1 Tax=Nibrella saemangeumensis TaxID=1084526 RepID=A0ABP8NSK0_9BACT